MHAAASKEPLSDVLFVCKQQHWDAPRPTSPARASAANGCWLLAAWPALAGALASAMSTGSSGGSQRQGRCADAVEMAQDLLLFPLKVLSPRPCS